MSRTGSRSSTKKSIGSVIDLLSDDEIGAGANQADASSNQEKKGDEIKKLKSTESSLDKHLSKLTLMAIQQSPRKTRSDRRTVGKDVLKILFGKKIYDEGCRIEFVMSKLTLMATKRNREVELTTIDLADERIEVKYFHMIGKDISRRQQFHPPFFSVAVEPRPAVRVEQYPNAFSKSSSDSNRKLAVVKFGSSADLIEVLECIRRSLPRLSPLRLKSSDAQLVYGGALQDHDENAREANANDAFVAGRNEDSVLLVYPFAGDCSQMEKAAAGLPEASGDLFAQSKTSATRVVDYYEQPLPDADVGTAELVSTAQSELRRHFLTIQVRDFMRLKPREFLNDTLIDFWIQW
jgi:hypothetical protein